MKKSVVAITITAGACLGIVAQADEIQFTTLKSERLREIADQVVGGKLRSRIEMVFSFAELPDALERNLDRQGDDV